MEVRVRNSLVADKVKVLQPGEDMPFGRSVGGVGRVENERETISRRHGLIVATDDAYTITSTGKFLGFVVVDQDTPSRLHIPCGMGPIAIPFAHARIEMEDGSDAASLEVVVEGSLIADRWKAQWSADTRFDDAHQPPGMLTREPFRPKVERSQHGKRPWFVTLVALCEPRLMDNGAGTPTNDMLSRRLKRPRRTIENHLEIVYQELDVLYRGRRRDTAVEIAIERRIVTRADLVLIAR